MAASFRNVTILHGQDGCKWCNYLVKTFQRPHFDFDIHTVNIDSLEYENPPEIEVSVRESYIVIILVTERCISYMESNAKWLSVLLEKRDNRVTSILAAMLGVDTEDIQEVCDINDYKYRNWKFTQIEADGSNTQEIVIDVLNIVEENYAKHKRMVLEDTQTFPVSTPHPAICRMYPNKVKMIQDDIALVFYEEINGEVTVAFNEISNPVNTTKVNPYCVTFTPPALNPGTHEVKILLDGIENDILEMHYCNAEFTSLELMKQHFGVNTADELDNLLADQFRQSLCTDATLERLIELTSGQKDVNPHGCRSTIMHWAAVNGLKKLTHQMLMSSCTVHICEMPSCSGETEAELAEKGGHGDSKDFISDCVETKECDDDCGLYEQADTFFDAYELYVQADASFDTNTSQVVKDKPNLETTSKDTPKGDVSVDYSNMDVPRQVALPDGEPPPLPVRDRIMSVPATTRDTAAQHIRNAQRLKLRQAAIGCRTQNELIDIMEQFKAGKINIQEAEMFFNGWQERNENGNAISFKQKQKGLQQIQETYKTSFSPKKAKDTKLPSLTKEQHFSEAVNISEPVATRGKNIGLSSRRNAQPVSGSVRGSDNSNSFRSSTDSGCHSEIYHEDVFECESLDSTTRNRKSLAIMYMELPPGNEESRPPLPPRIKKNGPVVYKKI